VALFSGGLDSALAVYLVRRSGVRVIGLHSTSFFSPSGLEDKDSQLRILADQLEIPLRFAPKGPEFLEIVKKPVYGHGKHLNPCIDCRILTLKTAKRMMTEEGASFIVTGEVVGQRPMSQMRHTLRLIEKQAGCAGLVLRPLSAKLLPPTTPELEGLVDRNTMMGIGGRGRKVQLALAEDLGLRGYAPPAGGCPLTEEGYSHRLRDLLGDGSPISDADLRALSLGRHLRVREGLKLIVGRNQRENEAIQTLALQSSLYRPLDFPGPVVLVRGTPSEEEDILIGAVILRYSKLSSRGEWILVEDRNAGSRKLRVTRAADEQWVSQRLL
jgi:tRNA-uridine 2-sulfurtransferase